MPSDVDAQTIYETLFPEREVVMIDADKIIESGGGLHCITMERPDYGFPTDDDTVDDDTTDDDTVDDDTIDDDAVDDDLLDDDVDDDAVDDDSADDDDDDCCGC